MSLIAMAVYSTETNGKDDCLQRTLQSLLDTVDFDRHRLMISVNGCTQRTREILGGFSRQTYNPRMIYRIIENNSNLGTAEAINKVWQRREKGEHCVKMDDDVVIHNKGWLDELEEAIRRDPSIGQAALKRKDLWENPFHENEFYRSSLYMLPHEPGQRWIIAEEVKHCIGTCVLHSSALLDKVGFLKQPAQYGLDDSLMSYRSRLAGFKNVFLPHIHIDHIDPGGGDYTEWKNKVATESFPEYHNLLAGYKDGSIPLYYNPFK
jgi:GT2 family glycosyltransferase